MNLWLIVRTSQLSVENQSEGWVEETLFVSNLYTTVAARKKKRVEHDKMNEPSVI